MSVVGRAVVKRFVTGVTGERAFGDAFVAASTFIRFLPSMDSLMVR